MIDQFLNSWQFNFWLGLASLGAGLVVVAPCLLIPSWRRRILRSDIDIEGVGLIALTVVIIAIGFYNYFAGR
jgi:threonine/homoserine/homoserine lactone efflux protein